MVRATRRDGKQGATHTKRKRPELLDLVTSGKIVQHAFTVVPKKIDLVMRRQVLEKMKYLKNNPRSGPNIKTMQGFSNRYRYRIGDFRVIIR